MKSQKQAVVDEVVKVLGSNFTVGKDNALSLLTKNQIESIKRDIAAGISNGIIAYGKSVSNSQEVNLYARSMVMNHLKKAKELNGGSSSVQSSTNTTQKSIDQRSIKERPLASVKLPKGVNAALLSEEMLEMAASLVK